jgi:hypothetical protein
MVKGRSCLGSNEAFRVQVLVGVLTVTNERKGNPIGDGTRLEAGRARLIAALRVQLPPLPLTGHQRCPDGEREIMPRS